MRLPIAGVGFTLACSALPAVAQTPAPSPAATLGRVQFLDVPGETARGQFSPSPLPRFEPVGLPRRAAMQAPAGQPGETLPQPKPLPGPKVGEERNGGTNPGPGVPIGPPTYPQPYGPQPVPYAQPVPYGQPVGPYTGQPLYQGVVGGPPAVIPGYDPTGVGGTVIPVSPGEPALSADGFSAGPIMDDPYLGGAGGGVFGFGGLPRARQALVSTVGRGQGRLQVTGEYLLWFVRAGGAPDLVTTSSPQFNGILGQGDTRTLFGGPGQVLNNTMHSGARFGALYYLPGNRWGVEGNIWFLGRNGSSFLSDTDQNPLLARPFVNANTGQQFSELVAAPGLATGAVSVTSGTSLWGADVNFRRGLFCGPCSRLDALVGFKFANLSEDITIAEQFVRTPNSNLLVGAPFAAAGLIEDKFETVNNFYGVNLGLAGELRRGRWFVNGRATVGLGTIYQSATITGSQRIITDTGGLLTERSGLLAIDGANAGTFTRPRFGVSPEVGLTLGMYITPRLRFGVGYGFQYLNRVLRPGNIIDPLVDVTRVPNFPVNPPVAQLRGTPRPALQLRETDFFAQGITFSLNWTW
jgi:hypothetical protein